MVSWPEVNMMMVQVYVTFKRWKLCLNFQVLEAALENVLAACSTVYCRWMCNVPLLAIKQYWNAGVCECYVLHLPLANLHSCSISHIYNFGGGDKCLPPYFLYLRIVFFWLLSGSGAKKQNWEGGERVGGGGVCILRTSSNQSFSFFKFDPFVN